MAGRCRICLASGVDGIALSGSGLCESHQSPSTGGASLPQGLETGPAAIASVAEQVLMGSASQSAGGGRGGFAHVDGDYPATLAWQACGFGNSSGQPVLEVKNTFLEVAAPRANTRVLRRNATDGDQPASAQRAAGQSSSSCSGARRVPREAIASAAIDVGAATVRSRSRGASSTSSSSGALSTERAPGLSLPHEPATQDSIFSFGITQNNAAAASGSQAANGSQDSALAEQASAALTMDDTDNMHPATRTEAIAQEHAEIRRRVFEDARGGCIACPLCDTFRGKSAAGLMRHLSCSHAGESLGDTATVHLATLHRGMCITPGCGAFRRFGVKHCSRCNCSTGIRPLEPEMVIALPPDRRIADVVADVAMPSAEVPVIPEEEDRRGLSDSFLERVRKLPASTVIHIPFSARALACEVMAQSLADALEGTVTANILEEARPRLIYSSPPRGVKFTTEVKERLNMWKEGSFEQLLTRIEPQHFDLTSTKRRRAKEPVPDEARASQRSRLLAADGALRKAVQSLTPSHTVMSDATQKFWAEQLLPQSQRPDSALSGFCANPTDSVTNPDNEMFGTDASDHPLRGIRFAALSAPGPSGARAVHIQEALQIKSRTVTSKLLKALRGLQSMASRGALPVACTWILRSRLIFLKKKDSTKPRPIRVGEILRRVVGKHISQRLKDTLQPVLANMRQWGVGVPGGCEAMVHFRHLIEAAAQNGTIAPLVCMDLDLQNCFCTLEWDAMRSDISNHAPDLLPWLNWQQQSASEVVLPCNAETTVARGAEQGDPLGSAIASLGIGAASTEAHAAHATPDNVSGVVDLWYMDDGQVFAKPPLADPFLRKLDARLESRGCSRARGDQRKSVARLLAPTGHTDLGWCTGYIADSCKLPDPMSGTRVLGAPVGRTELAKAMMTDATATAAQLHTRIGTVDDPATELVLTRKCADVAHIMYLLRVCGDMLDADDLAPYDCQLKSAVEWILRGDMDDNSWTQSGLGVRQGGLGMRSASQCALIAAVSSMADARGKVHEMCQNMVHAGLADAGLLEDLFDARLEAAVQKLIQRYDPEVGAAMRSLIQKAADSINNDESAAEAPLAGGGATRPGSRLVADMAASDAEMPQHHQRNPGLQRALHKLADNVAAAALLQSYADIGETSHVLRLQELQAAGTDHTWLWRLGANLPDKLSPDEFVSAARLRLGVAVMSDDRVCSYCGESVLDIYGHHSLVCAGAEATRGHTDVKDKLLDLALKADPAAESEPVSLIQSRPSLRPADVLTAGAVQGTLAALDVGVTAPSAADGDTHCTEAYKSRKLRKYSRHLQDLAQQGVQYKPLIWSAWGRPHADCATILQNLSSRAARRRGLTSGAAIKQHAAAAVGAALQRRACRMLHACLGDADPEAEEPG